MTGFAKKGVVLSLVAILGVTGPVAVVAQQTGGRQGGSWDNSGGPGVPLDRETTDTVLRRLSNTNEFCSQVPRIYVVDCIRQYYQNIALSLPRNGDYAEIKQILDRTNAKLSGVVRANADRSNPTVHITAKLGGRDVREGPMRPVRADRLPEVNRQATAILAETETLLLRSAENSQRRQLHFTQVAAAIGSNKVLLRS